MRVLNVSSADYANYGHENAKALRSIGIDCLDFVRSPHPFGYKTESILANVQAMIAGMQNCDVIQIMHSDPYLFELAKANSKAKIILYHTGTRYREGHKELDLLFGDTTSVTDQSEFSVLGNHHYIVSPVEFDLAPIAKQKPLKFAHYPSNVEVKGTAKILEMMNQFGERCEWKFGTTTVDHATQLQRMSQCDVYIELFKPELNGRPYGCFGVTALEAAAMGRIVITNNLHNDIYLNNYGRLPFNIANTELTFSNTVNGLINLDLGMIREMQKQTWEIMRENHSYTATGRKILEVING